MGEGLKNNERVGDGQKARRQAICADTELFFTTQRLTWSQDFVLRFNKRV